MPRHNVELPKPLILDSAQAQVVNDRSVVFSARRPGIDLAARLNSHAGAVHRFLLTLADRVERIEKRLAATPKTEKPRCSVGATDTEKGLATLDFSKHSTLLLKCEGSSPAMVRIGGAEEGERVRLVAARSRKAAFELQWPAEVLWPDGQPPAMVPNKEDGRLVVELVRLEKNWLGRAQVFRPTARPETGGRTPKTDKA